MLTLATLQQTTSPFPTQFEGAAVDCRPVYIRCKHGELRVHVGEPAGSVSDAVASEPVIRLEFADDRRSELDWIEIAALTGIRVARTLGTVAIRDAVTADIDEIATFMRSVRETAMPYLPRLHDGVADRRVVGSLLDTSTVRVAWAERLVGFCARRPAWVDQLYVAAEVGQRGVGSALLGEALIGAETVDLWTFQRNVAAHRFYLHRGFAEVEWTDGGRNEEGEPDIRMRWTRGLRP